MRLAYIRFKNESHKHYTWHTALLRPYNYVQIYTQRGMLLKTTVLQIQRALPTTVPSVAIVTMFSNLEGVPQQLLPMIATLGRKGWDTECGAIIKVCVLLCAVSMFGCHYLFHYIVESRGP